LLGGSSSIGRPVRGDKKADFTNDADWTFTNHATQTLGSFAIGMRF
jgi:hypothetical protein